jgi:serine phosphatase RsbU (regulator of sigma subunit)
MAMTMLKIKGNQASLSCAGMPSVLVYRDATKQVEEISMPAMPLGSVASFPYREREISLSKGDTVVLMSDGFPEMFNEQNEMLGYDKGELTLRENSHLSAQEIIDRFVETAYQWAGNRPADDDVTFVVMKVK